MTILKIKKIFLSIVIASSIMLSIVIYRDISFKNNPLSSDIVQKIEQKKQHLVKLVYQKYGFYFDVPVLVSDKLPDNLFGLAAYTTAKEIKIYLNKKRFQESVEYMIDYVLPHEYAHALMFRFGDFSKENGGHTLKWQKVCLSLEGKKCDRYVKHQDVIYGKVPF